MANYSVLSPGLAVQLTVGSQEWDAVVRVRLPDQIYFELAEPAPPLFNTPQLATVQWQSTPLIWQLSVELQTMPMDDRFVVGQLLSAPRPFEQRRMRRFAWQWPVRIRWGLWPHRRTKGMTEDLSVAGCRCHVAQALAEKEDLTVTLQGPQRSWQCRAALLRQTQDSVQQWTAVILWVPGQQTADWQQWISAQS